MDNILKGVLLGAAVLLTIGVIAIGIVLYNSGQQVVTKAEQDLVGISNALSMSKFQSYDNTVVSGSQVIGAIRLYSDQGTLNVVVTTLGSTTAQTYTAANKYTIIDPANVSYINPTGNFKATLTINANKVVTAINFVQQ